MDPHMNPFKVCFSHRIPGDGSLIYWLFSYILAVMANARYLKQWRKCFWKNNMKISYRWWEKVGRRSQQGKIEKYDIFSIKYATRKFLAVAVQNNSKEMYKKKIVLLVQSYHVKLKMTIYMDWRVTQPSIRHNSLLISQKINSVEVSG